MTFDIHQDFHLPDDQFASLKLHKLRQVAVESGVELFTSPSYNTRSSSRLPRSYPCYSTSDPVVPLSLPLSLTPTVSMEENPACVDVQNLQTDSKLVDESLAEESSDRDTTETPGEQQTENLDVKTLPVSVAQESPADCEHDTKKQDTVDSQSRSNTHRSVDDSVKPQPYMNCADGPASKVDVCVVEQSNELKIKQPASEPDSYCSGAVCSVDDQTSTNQRREDRAVIKTLCFDCPPGESAEEASNSRSAAQTCETSQSSPPPRIPSQVLLSPPLTSAHCPFTTPHLASSALLSSPTLPSLGLTPCLPLTSSPSAPALTPPPPHSLATHALSPPAPALSPCPSITSLPPSRPLASRSSQDRASSQLAADCHPSVEPATFATASSLQSQGTARQEGERMEETAERHVITHTLKVQSFSRLN